MSLWRFGSGCLGSAVMLIFCVLSLTEMAFFEHGAE